MRRFTSIRYLFRHAAVCEAGLLTLPEKSVEVSYGDHAFIDALRFGDGSTYKDIPYGRGHLLITSCPLELADGNDATAAAYRTALSSAGLASPYELRIPVHGVLIRPTVFADSTLYLFSSETWTDQDIDIADNFRRAHSAAIAGRALRLR